MRILLFSTLLILSTAIISCSKDNNSPTGGSSVITPPPPPSTPTLNVDGKWQCKINGQLYAGTIDTSIIKYNTTGTKIDTLIWCTGTTNDKKANISFYFILNRSASGNTISTQLSGYLAFDTVATKFLQAYYSGSQVSFVIDSALDSKIKGSFSGQIRDVNDINSVMQNVTEGKFSFEFGKGTAEPKFFSFTNSVYRSGYVKYAGLVSNSLIIDGMPFAAAPDQRFRLVLRTGGTIKTGTYKSNQGDAGMYFFTPSIYLDYVNDSLGNLTVNITSVNGGIVYGNFTGINSSNGSISGGTFSCRVKNYIPQPELSSRWQFSFDDQSLQYNCYAGNIINAVKSQNAGKNYLTIQGESDWGASVYKLVLSSTNPISTGIYKPLGVNAWLDSAYFRSPTPIFNGNNTYLFSGNTVDTWCSIDTIDAAHVVGTLFGKLRVYYSSSGFSTTSIKFGQFRANF